MIVFNKKGISSFLRTIFAVCIVNLSRVYIFDTHCKNGPSEAGPSLFIENDHLIFFEEP